MQSDKRTVHGNLKTIVLSLFAENKELHGYGIIKSLRVKYGVYEGPSSIYPIVTEFERRGLLKSRWDIIGSRARKLYSMTDKGEQELKNCAVSFQIIAKEVSKIINTCNDNIG